jgi:hypothetical protein
VRFVTRRKRVVTPIVGGVSYSGYLQKAVPMRDAIM